MKTHKKDASILRFIYFLIIVLVLQNCDSRHLNKTPIENFIGTWELQGREMFNGIKISIEMNNDGTLVGKVVELNDNKYVKLFVEMGDIWVSEISRSSNFEFSIIEKKIASPLFSAYGQETSKEFKAQFIDNNTIGLGSQNSDPLKSSIKYIRVEK